jgi:hypothetical protein
MFVIAKRNAFYRMKRHLNAVAEKPKWGREYRFHTVSSPGFWDAWASVPAGYHYLLAFMLPTTDAQYRIQLLKCVFSLTNLIQGVGKPSYVVSGKRKRTKEPDVACLVLYRLLHNESVCLSSLVMHFHNVVCASTEFYMRVHDISEEILNIWKLPQNFENSYYMIIIYYSV